MESSLTAKHLNISVIGASGKMGRGILLLVARNIFEDQKKDIKTRTLFAVDLSEKGLEETLNYVKKQSRKFAEKNLTEIKSFYKDNKTLICDQSFIEQYIIDVIGLINFSTEISSTYNSTLIFEAIAEREELKADLFKTIDRNSNVTPYFFSNTSSIPISQMELKADIAGRLVGLHFYNPPPVQKLLEIIEPINISSELSDLTSGLAIQFGKIVVNAPDKPGFIGNGQFIREISSAIEKITELAKTKELDDAIYTLNSVTKEELLRPMGIFEVMDYVGIDVCLSIMDVMKKAFRKENFNGSLLIDLLKQKMRGGQDENGRVKNGVFKYYQGEIIAVFNGNEYKSISPNNKENTFSYSWKELKRSNDLENQLSSHFSNLKESNSFRSRLAFEHGNTCKQIALGLVNKQIAYDADDVNKVMTLGFHHLYGPVNKFFD